MKRKRSFDEDSFMNFLKENYTKLTEAWQDENGVWGSCCTSVGFSNHQKNRKLLHIRWQNNYAGIRNRLIAEKKEDDIVSKTIDTCPFDEPTANCNVKSSIDMIEPSFAMLQCSNCSVFYIFSSMTYDKCPLIDYLCSYCSLSSSEFEKRTKINKLPTSINDSPLKHVNQKERLLDHGYCDENKKGVMANIDNFVNEVTVETSNMPSKGNTSTAKKNNVGMNKFVNNEHVIYISDKTEKNSSKKYIEKSTLTPNEVESARYQFILSHNHWNQIYESIGQNFNIMCGNIFRQYFSQFDLGCNLSYTYCHINKENSLQQGLPYLKVIGICKVDFCAKYIFSIDTLPKADVNIVVNISQIGSLCHDNVIDVVNSILKSESSIISVDEPSKFNLSNQYDNAEISVQEGSPAIPVQYSTNYYLNDDRQMEECNYKSDNDEDMSDGSEVIPESADAIFDYSSHNQFTLDYKDWEKIMPSFDEQKFKKGWQRVFADYFNQFDLGCNLEFYSCQIRKPFSMDNSVYLSTYAKCWFPNCSTFLFKITHKPIKGEIVIVDVYQQGSVSHKTDETMDYNSPNKKITDIHCEEADVYYGDNREPVYQKSPLDLDVSQVVTVETSQGETMPGECLNRHGVETIKCELASSGSDTNDSESFNFENQILPYELNSEGKVLESFVHKFEISYDDWLKMKPPKHSKTLQPGWTDIFFKYFANLNLGCILAFSYCYANKRSVIKKGTNYLRIKSICKYTGCCKYYFNMKKEPKPGKPGKVKAIQVGQISHREGEVRARFIRGKYRKELAKQLENTSAFDFYNKNRSSLAESGYESTRKKSLHVLRNIKIKKKKDSLTGSSSELDKSDNFETLADKIDNGCIRLL